MFFIQLLVYVRTVEPRYNEPLWLYNEVPDVTNDFLYPNNSRIYEKALKKNLDITKPGYSKQILSAPCPFITESRFHCSMVLKLSGFFKHSP